MCFKYVVKKDAYGSYRRKDAKRNNFVLFFQSFHVSIALLSGAKSARSFMQDSILENNSNDKVYNSKSIRIFASSKRNMRIVSHKKLKEFYETKGYEFALARVEELLPLVDDNTPANDKNAVELTLMSDIVIAYEKEHYPIEKPTVEELIKLSLEEKEKHLLH